MLLEAGVDFARNQQYPVSGLEGNLWRIPTVGLSFGVSSIAELQIDAGPYNRLTVKKRVVAPLSNQLSFAGTTTHDVEDAVVAFKIRILPETGGRPAFGIRFATKLPNASNESGLGLDTTDFSASILGAKTVESVRFVGNFGVAILTDPTFASRQNDVILYGVSFARAMTTAAEVVGELNGRASTRAGGALPGTENRSMLRFGVRYTQETVRFDGGLLFGLTAVDPTIGFTAGLTYVFNAFHVP
jgi:hypothetical protein